MLSGSSLTAAAARLLRILLPVCVLAVTAVAVLGLFRVVGQRGATAVSQDSPSLRLGPARSGGADLPDAVALPTATPSATVSPTATPTPAATRPESLTTPVVVMNATGISGLAGRTATALRSRGVSIASIGNLSVSRGLIMRTVFYPPGRRGQAQALATLSHAPAVAPTPAWLRADGRLVLVVTEAGTP